MNKELELEAEKQWSMKNRTYTLDEVIILIKAFHLDTQKGKYSKELLDWCNKWIEDNIKNSIQ